MVGLLVRFGVSTAVKIGLGGVVLLYINPMVVCNKAVL